MHFVVKKCHTTKQMKQINTKPHSPAVVKEGEGAEKEEAQ